MKHQTTGWIIVLALLLGNPLAFGQEILRLTDKPSEKPCIVVSAQGTHVAWTEAEDAPAPANRLFRVLVFDTAGKTTREILQVPGITSNLPMQALFGSKQEIRGPNYNPSDLNYRIIGDNTQIRLSGDGRYLVTCVMENHNTTQRTPFFVIADLAQNSVQTLPVQIPEALGTLSGNLITSILDPMYWDLSPDGKKLAYVLNVVNSSDSAVVLYDLAAKTSRRVLGYERAAFANGTLTVDGPADQRVLYGRQIQMGNQVLVVPGKNRQGQEGLWIVNLAGGAIWHEAPGGPVGVAGDHVYFSAQKPAVWLNPDGSPASEIEQQDGVNHFTSVPFWSGSGGAYALGQNDTALVQLGSGSPALVADKNQMGVPATWRFQLKATSSAESYRLASDTGAAMVLPVLDPASQMVDLFLMRREMPGGNAVAAGPAPKAIPFRSQVDAFVVGSLLKPGELTAGFTPKEPSPKTEAKAPDLPAQKQAAPPAAALPDLPPVWTTPVNPAPLPALSALPSLTDSPEQAYDEAKLILALGELNDETLANVIDRLEKAVALAPFNRQYRLDLAQAYVAANTVLSVGAGIEQYSLLLHTDKKDDDALAGLADAYAQSGNLDQALEIAYLRTVMNPEEEPVLRSAALQMAVLGLETGDQVGSLTWLRQLHGQYPENGFIQGLIGLLWQMDGNTLLAQAIFDKAVENAPPDDPVHACIARVRQALAERKVQ